MELFKHWRPYDGVAAEFFLSFLGLEEPEWHSYFLTGDGNTEFLQRFWEADSWQDHAGSGLYCSFLKGLCA